jgi:hypothetical protein
MVAGIYEKSNDGNRSARRFGGVLKMEYYPL